ncbi:unnamed protein product, partial [marine sediment metagenome]
RYNFGGPNETVAERIAYLNFSIGSSPNQVDVTVTTLYDPSQPESADNPQVTLISSVVLRAMSAN